MGSCTAKETENTDEIVSSPVHVMEVRPQDKQEKLNLIGTIEVDREMRVGFKLPGKITHLAFEEGQNVQVGALLAQLDKTELLAQKEKALENKSKARRDFERMDKLFRQEIIPESSFQDARSAYNLSCAELKIVEDALKNCSIRAPFTGKIIKKLGEDGEVVAAGTPIALLAETDPILVKVAIPDHLLPDIKLGDKASVAVDWAPGKRFTGTIHRVEPSADPVTRTIRVEILVADAHGTLKPGLMAQVALEHKGSRKGLYLPLDAVIGFGKEPYVFVVGDNLNAEKREIKLGKVIKQEVEVTEGLAAGEAVVISGQEYLRDQQHVSIEGRSTSNL
jgi:RND family efflux transporter MFP subunit